MQLEGLIEKLEEDLQNFRLVNDVLYNVKEFPLKRLDDLESARSWVVHNEDIIKKKIERLRILNNLITVRVKRLNIVLYVLACVNLVFLLWNTPFLQSLMSSISMIAVFALAVCRANPLFRWRPVITAVIIPIAALSILYYVPFTKNLIDQYVSAITFLGVIYSVLLIILGNKIDNSQQWR